VRDTDIPTFEGFGLALRPTHFPEFLEKDRLADFVEIISENFLATAAYPPRRLPYE
jgi:uncharacterized protein (UPF0276 family)